MKKNTNGVNYVIPKTKMKRPSLPLGWKLPFWVNDQNGIDIWVQDSSSVATRPIAFKGACLLVGSKRECDIVCYALNEAYPVKKKKSH